LFKNQDKNLKQAQIEPSYMFVDVYC